MVLKLYWRDIKENTYMLGKLYKENDKYYFDIDEKELKKATHNGCFGIGELNLLYTHHASDELFPFFKRRLPAKDQEDIEKIMKELNIKEYDEMEILAKTKGILSTDRYYLEEM